MKEKIAGISIMCISAIHFLFGVVFGRRQLQAIWNDGLWNSIDSHPDRQIVFWFLFASPLMFLLGQMLYKMIRQAPRYLGWQLLVITGLGCFLMPASGFWLMLIPSIALLRK